MYDVIIIGAGIAGLAVGAKLANQRKKILVLEKESNVGGYFSSFFAEEKYKFDYAVSFILSCGKEDVVTNFMDELGINDKIQFKKLLYTDDIYIPDLNIKFAKGREEFSNILKSNFRHCEKEIDHLVDWLVKFKDGTEVQNSEAMKFFFKYFRMNYEEFLKKNISDEKLRAILSIRIQADPASLMIMAGFITECYFKGMYYPCGGAQALANVFSDYICSNGGSVLCDSEVVKINTKGDKVVWVTTSDGRKFDAANFVYNADIFSLYDKYLLENKTNKDMREKMSKKVVGHSSLNIYLAVDNYDLSKYNGGRIYWTNTYDIFGTYRKIEAAQIPEEYIIKLHFPTLIDSTLTDTGDNIIRIETDLYYNPEISQEEYIKYAESIINILDENMLIGFKKHIKYKKIITPIEFKKIFGHFNGSGTGWAHTTENTMILKFSQKTNYKNLYIAGQWGEFGSGLRQLILSAEKTVGFILKNK